MSETAVREGKLKLSWAGSSLAVLWSERSRRVAEYVWLASASSTLRLILSTLKGKA